MKWLSSLFANAPAYLTPEHGERILDIVSEALQREDYPYHPRSSLKGYDAFQVDAALKLRIANDYLLLSLVGREAELVARAEQWGSIPHHVLTQFVDDAELNKLNTLSEDSSEYGQLLVSLIPDAVDENGFTDPRFASLELLDSFAKYCMYVGAKDPLYWQKVYTRIDLPYGKGCPRGNEPLRP